MGPDDSWHTKMMRAEPVMAYDRFTSQYVQYQRKEMTHMARLVEQRLETLVALAVEREQETPSSHE
jgi:hypothetical protein